MHASPQSANEPTVQIREYRATDFEEICELDRICFAERVAYSPEEMAFGLTQRGAFTLVAEAESRAVAFLLATTGRRGSAHIITIDVHPDFRRLKIGARLMDLAEERIREAGAKRIVLEVATLNDTALAFYRKRGFVPLKLLPRYYNDGTDAYLMEKAL